MDLLQLAKANWKFICKLGCVLLLSFIIAWQLRAPYRAWLIDAELQQCEQHPELTNELTCEYFALIKHHPNAVIKGVMMMPCSTLNRSRNGTCHVIILKESEEDRSWNQNTGGFLLPPS